MDADVVRAADHADRGTAHAYARAYARARARLHGVNRARLRRNRERAGRFADDDAGERRERGGGEDRSRPCDGGKEGELLHLWAPFLWAPLCWGCPLQSATLAENLRDSGHDGDGVRQLPVGCVNSMRLQIRHVGSVSAANEPARLRKRFRSLYRAPWSQLAARVGVHRSRENGLVKLTQARPGCASPLEIVHYEKRRFKPLLEPQQTSSRRFCRARTSSSGGSATRQ